MLDQGADALPTVAACAEASSRALAGGGFVVAPVLRVGEGASWLLGVDRPFRQPQILLCWLDVLDGLVGFRG